MLQTRRDSGRRVLPAVEVLVAAVVVVADVGIPSLVVLALLAISLVVRRQGPRSIGFVRLARPWATGGTILLLTAGWTAVQFGLVMPVLNRLTSSHQDFAAFEDLEGNVPLLLALLAASWLLGAVVEEAVFRGYLTTRVREAAGAGTLGLVLAVLVPAILFSLIHTEQGQVGMGLTFLDALFFVWLRFRFASTWAAVLGHGFSNTIGVVTFFLVGPVTGLW